MTGTDKQRAIDVRLTAAQWLAAGAVLRGYLEHQRERLGDQAASNPNFVNVEAALRAIDAQVGPPPAARG